MSSTGHLPELESLRSQVADLARELAERDQAMQARHETERRLRFTQFAVDHAVDGVLWADESRRFIYVNDTVCRSLGYSREELLSLGIADIAPLHDPERFQRRLDEILQGTPAIYESIHRRKDGSEFPVEVSVTFLEHEGKGYTCGIIRDITERRRIEQEHLHALHSLQNIMDTVPDFMFTLDTRGNLVKWNRRVREVTGYSAEELLNKPALDFVPLEEQDQTAAAIRTAFTEGYAELDGHLLTKERRLIPYHWTGALLKDPYGQPIGVTGVGRDVSEKKMADEVLQRQQSRLVEAQALAHLGSWEWDIDTGGTIWSEEQFRIFGHEPQAIEITYDTFLAALLPDDHDRVLSAINDALLGKAPCDIECRIVRPTGEVRTISCRGEVTRSSDGHPLRMSGTVLDITDRKQIEEALRASEERWHLAIRGSNDGIWDWNLRSGEVFFSARWKEMRGYGELELTNSLDEWRSRIHPDDLDRVLQRLDAYLARQTSDFCEEYRVLRKDGAYMWGLDRGVALWDRAGQPVRMAGSESDITIRKLAEEKLQRTQFAMDSAVDAIYWIDPAANILYANNAAGTMLGYSPGELQTMTVHDLNPDFQADRWPDFWAESRHRKPLTLESFHRAKQGHLIPVELQVNFLAHDGQEFHCAFVRNITERKRAEEALAERARLAEFVADISLAINQDQSVDDMIDHCIAKTVRHLHAAFVHVWTIEESGDRCDREATEDPGPDQRPWVSLPISNGLSLNLHGEHRRASSRILKIGGAALEIDTVWTNDVFHDDRLPDKQWMQENGLHSFAGIPLIVEGRVFGIIGVFGRTPLSEPTVSALESVSHGMAAAIARKLMAEDLCRSKAQLSDIMENNPAVLYTRRVGDEWPFTFVTPNIFGLLGYTSIDMISDVGLLDSLMHPDDLAKLMAQTLPSFLRKGAETFVARLRHRDGQYRWIENQARLTHLGDGPLLMVGTMTDITERMQVEEAVARSRDLLTSFVEHTPAAVAMLDKDFRYLAVSHRWLQDYRLGDQDLTGKHHYDVFPEIRQMAEWQAIHRRCLAGAVERCEEDRLIRADGSEDWLQWEVRPWHDVTGEIGGIIMFTDVITERKRAEVALRESEARTRSILETALDAVISINERGRIIGWNLQAEVMFGYSPHEALGLPLDETIIPPRYRQAHVHGMNRMLQSGDGAAVRRRFEFFALHRDGHEFPIEFTIAASEVDRQPMFTAFIRDISERKRAEEALEANRRHLAEAQSLAHLGSWVWELHASISTWSDENYRIFGYEPHSIQPSHETFTSALHDEDRERVLQATRATVKDKAPYDLECRIVRPNGEIRHVHCRGEVTRDEMGQPIRMAGTVLDISERKRVEAALRTSEEKLRQALQASNTGLWDWNTDTNAVSLSREWKRQLGFEEEELANTFESWETRLHPGDHDRALAHVRTYLENPVGDYQQEFRLRHKDGTYRWFQARASLVTEPDGRRVRLLGSHMDVTDRKRTEEALQRSERQLRTVLDTLPIGIWFTDEKGHVLYGNPVGQRIWAGAARVGLPQPGGNSLWWETIDHTESLHRWAVGTVLARGHDVPNEMLEIETHRGDRRTIRNSAVPVKGDAGEILGAIVLNEDITDRVRTEQALRQEHALLMAVMDAATDIIFVKDIAGRYIHMNRAGAHTLGMAVEEVIGWNEYALWPSDLAASCQLADRRVLETGEPITVEETSVSDGKTTIYLTTKAPYRDPEGRIIGVIGVARDITERKQAEEALRASEERFAKAFRSSPYPIIISEVESGLFIDANDAAFRSFGYRREEVTNRTSTEFQLWPTPDHRKRFVEHLQQAGAIRNLEIELRMQSGELRHCLVSAELIELHGKRCMVTVGSDITEQKRAEQNLQRSHAFIRQIIDTDPNFIFAKDREGRFTLVNKAFADAYGSTVDKLIGRTDADFNRNAEEATSFLSKDRNVIERLQDQFIPEERITDATGAIRWLQTVKRPILDETGRATMILGASTDITERKRIEEALRQRERDLRAALEERERISQDLHDGILQSLYAVGLGLEACKPLMTHRHYKKAVATMTEAIGQLNHVMSEVRNFIAGLESQVLQGSTFPVALHEMVDTLAATHPLRCTVALDKTAADHISTEQALHLLNIVREALSNSLRHAQATKATVMLKPLSRFIRLSIADNGIGFDPASMRGVGHGLTNMAARARKVGGRFTIKSLPQHGTRITIDLPKENSHAESESERDSTPARR